MKLKQLRILNRIKIKIVERIQNDKRIGWKDLDIKIIGYLAVLRGLWIRRGSIGDFHTKILINNSF